MKSIISASKEFFFLTPDLEDFRFSFGLFNLLSDVYDIDFSLTVTPKPRRNVRGLLVSTKQDNKFRIKLRGRGPLKYFTNGQVKSDFRFVSSHIQLQYHHEDNRMIAFDRLFEKNNVPFVDQVNNLDDLHDDEKINLFYLPVINCKITDLNYSADFWTLSLEEK